VLAAFCPDGGLAEKGFAGGEGVEELTVEVVSVGEDDDGRVLGGDALGDFARVKCHCETFTAALGVPDNADFSSSPPLLKLCLTRIFLNNLGGWHSNDLRVRLQKS